MTANEFHKTKVIPARQEVQRLEQEWERLNRLEKAEAAGLKWPTCDNCAYSCVLMISDHNECLGGKCTCCHDYCYKWMADNSVSTYLREHHHYDEFTVFRLEKIFGDDILKCDNLDLVLKALQLMDEIKEKARDKKQ